MIWDEHTYLMVDFGLDAEVDNLSMVREEAWKFEGNPIADESTKSLFGGEEGFRMWASCICRDGGLYRMWYKYQPASIAVRSHRERLDSDDFRASVWYAESDDGVLFRPGKVPGSAGGNRIDLRVPGVPGVSVTGFFHDPLDAEYPYKCVYYRPGKGSDVYAPHRARWPRDPDEKVPLVWGIGRSRDGLSWEPPKHDHFLVPANPENAKLHRSLDGGLVIADQGMAMGEWAHRGVWGFITYDCETAELIPDYLFQTPQHMSRVFSEYSGPAFDRTPWAQPHIGLRCARKGPTIVALHGYLYGATAVETHAQVADVGLAVSSTGIGFKEVWPFRPFIRRGERGRWDCGLVGQCAIVDTDAQTRFYYLASDVGNADGCAYRLGFAYVDQDRYGYRALKVNRDYAEPKDRTGTLTLKPIVLPADPAISVNVSHVTEHRTVQAELLDDSGQAIPGFSFEKCVPVGEAGIRQPITWQGKDVKELAGREVSIRAKLHSPDCRFGDQHSPRLYAIYTK